MTLKVIIAVAAAFVIFTTATPDAADQKSDINNLRKLLTDHFSTNRHHVTNPAGKKAAVTFLVNTLRSYGLQTWDWPFEGEHKYTGTNTMAFWPGRNTGSALDRPICVTADLDTAKNGPGRDDNGSGLAAVIETARLISSQTCVQDNTVFFFVFDFEEEDHNPDTACSTGSCGSAEFVKDFLQDYITFSNVDPAMWSGFITMDAILNYNNSAMSQDIPNEEAVGQTPGLADFCNSIKEDNYRGNFLTAVYRRDGDSQLHSKFESHWNKEGDPQYKILSPVMPYKNITAVVDAKEGPYWQAYQLFVMNDVHSFWKGNEDIPAILLTDTGDLRDREKVAWGPDDPMELTTDRLQFLKKTTDVITAVVRDMAGARVECRDPVAESPAGFQTGLKLSGELTLGPSIRSTYQLHISSFTSSGIVMATLSNTSWTMDFQGRYDGDTHLLFLRPEFFHGIQLYKPLYCAMTGNLEELSDGVLYSGQLDGNCGLTGEEFAYVTFVLYSRGSGGASLAVSVILSLAGGTLPTALAAWCISKRRRGYKGM